MVLTDTGARATSTSFTRPAWLLIATLPAYVIFLVASATLMRPRVEVSSAELTQTQLDELGWAFTAVAVLWVIPPVLAAIAFIGLARQLPPSRSTRVVPLLAAVAIVLAGAYVVVHLLAAGTDAPTWGESGLFSVAVIISLLMGWLGVHPATLLTLRELIRGRLARRTAIVVAILYVLYWILEILLYLPVLADPDSAIGMEDGLPPFLLGFFWAAVGGALLRRGVPSER